MQKLTTRLYRFHNNVDNKILPFLVEVYLDICRVIFLICLQATNMNILTLRRLMSYIYIWSTHS